MSTDASAFVDRPAPPRADERLDTAALQAWMAGHLELAGPIEVRQFPAGHSNLTYWVGDGRSQWVLRRPPYGSAGIVTSARTTSSAETTPTTWPLGPTTTRR